MYSRSRREQNAIDGVTRADRASDREFWRHEFAGRIFAEMADDAKMDRESIEVYAEWSVLAADCLLDALGHSRPEDEETT